MSGRNKIFNEEEVVDKAIQVFWKNGYEPSSTEQLLSAMGIGKGSFYHSFPGGKKELFEKALDQFSRSELSKLRETLLTAVDPLEEIKKFFLRISDTPIGVHEKGCFLCNSIAELSNTDDDLKNRAVQLLKELESLFCEALKMAKDNHLLVSNESVELLGRHLITLWNGLSITRRMYHERAILRELIQMQLKVLT